MESFSRIALALIAGIAFFLLVLVMTALLPGCASQIGPPATQPTTAPTSVPAGPTLLQILQTSLNDTQAVISVAEAFGLITGPTAVEVNAVEAAAVAALNLASGSPNNTSLTNDAALRIKALVTHPAFVAAKKKMKLVPAIPEP